MADSPYPELKKTHSMARVGRPWRDHKPPPSAPVWALIQGFGSYWALVAAVELGVFDALQSQPASAAEISAAIGASPRHLTHLLDALLTFGLLDRVHDRYELTETAERYLCRDSPASMAALVSIAPGPHDNWIRLVDTIRSGHVRHPIDDNPAGFYGPLVTATFATQFRAAGRVGIALGWARRPGLRVLDLGAGRAPWAISVLEQSPGSHAVVNDLPGVAELAQETLRAHGVEARSVVRAGSFHELQIDRASFDVVVLGHVCRTEGDERARSLVARAAAGLAPGGQLILADYFADDERKHNAFGVQMGLTMVASTQRGGILTYGQVRGWLHEVGLEHIRLLEPIGFNHVFVASAPQDRSS